MQKNNLLGKYVYTVRHDRLNLMGKIKSHKEIDVGDEIAYGSNRLKVVAGNRREIVVTKVDEINVVELYDMDLNKVEFNQRISVDN